MKYLFIILLILFCGCKEKKAPSFFDTYYHEVPRSAYVHEIEAGEDFREKHGYDSATTINMCRFVDTAKVDSIGFKDSRNKRQWWVYYPNLKLTITYQKRIKFEDINGPEWNVDGVDSLGRTAIDGKWYGMHTSIFSISDSAVLFIAKKLTQNTGKPLIKHHVILSDTTKVFNHNGGMQQTSGKNSPIIHSNGNVILKYDN